jgi:hypothetical protein
VGFKLKSLGSFVMKPVAKIIDPLLPEFAKKGLDKIDAMSGNLLAGGAFGKPLDTSTGAPAAPAAPVETKKMGSIEESEAQEIVAKRLARMSRYFTSPLGTNTLANTASQKVFS